MARNCVNCGKKLGLFDEEFYLYDDFYTCGKCVESIRTDIDDVYRVKSQEEFLTLRAKIVEKASQSCNQKTVELLVKKANVVYNNLNFVNEKINIDDGVSDVKIEGNTVNENVSGNTASTSDTDGAGMFSNIGGKIKNLAIVVTWIGIISSVILGIIMMATGYGEMVLIGFLVALVGSLLSWVGSFLLYGFGQLIENTDTIVKKLK